MELETVIKAISFIGVPAKFLEAAIVDFRVLSCALFNVDLEVFLDVVTKLFQVYGTN